MLLFECGNDSLCSFHRIQNEMPKFYQNKTSRFSITTAIPEPLHGRHFGKNDSEILLGDI